MSIKVPYILTCLVTGIRKSYTSAEFVNRKIENYGGDEAAMVAGYVCKDAKRELKAFDLDKLTVGDVQSVITKLGGTTDAQTVLDLIKGGKLFLTKKVKVRAAGKSAAGSSKKGKGKKSAKKSTKKNGNKKTSKKSGKRTRKSKVTATPAAPAMTPEVPAMAPAATDVSPTEHSVAASEPTVQS